jgi:hypothetical protein
MLFIWGVLCLRCARIRFWLGPFSILRLLLVLIGFYFVPALPLSPGHGFNVKAIIPP